MSSLLPLKTSKAPTKGGSDVVVAERFSRRRGKAKPKTEEAQADDLADGCRTVFSKEVVPFEMMMFDNHGIRVTRLRSTSTVPGLRSRRHHREEFDHHGGQGPRRR